MSNCRVERTRRNLDLRRPAHAPPKPEPTLRGAGRALKLPDPLRPTETDKTIRILIADDHDVVRRGLRALLDLDPALEVVGEAVNGAQAVHFAHRLRPDVVLMDLAMPELDGIAATEVIHRELPNTSVVVLTSLLEDEPIVRALRAGAVGYLLKDTGALDLRQAVKTVVAGQTPISPKAAARLVRKVIAPERPETLSKREAEVLRLLARGSANKEIGRDLSIAEKTRQEPREQHPGQAGGPESDAGRALCRACWPGPARRTRRSRHRYQSATSSCLARD